MKIYYAIKLNIFRKLAAVSCRPVPYWLGGVDRCNFVTGKPSRVWVGAWVHGMVLGVGGLPYLFGVPDPVTSLLGCCYMKWIFDI